MKRRIVGTGFSGRVFLSPENVREAAELRDERIRRRRQWSEDFSGPGRLFSAVSAPAQRICEATVKASGHDGPYVEDTAEAHADEILTRISLTLHAIEKDDAAQAAADGWKAGAAWMLAYLKFAWEADAIRGEKVAGGFRNSAHKTNAKHVKGRSIRLTRMAELVPSMGVLAAACQCEVEGLGGREAIKSTWYRHNKSCGT